MASKYIKDITATAPNTTDKVPVSDGGTTAKVVTVAGLAAVINTNPVLTGIPTAPTAPLNTNTTQVATMAALYNAIVAITGGAPAALDAFNEFATALGNDPNFASTMTTALASKAPLASPVLTGVPIAPTAAVGTNTTQVATTALVKATGDTKSPIAGPGSSQAFSVGALSATTSTINSTGYQPLVLQRDTQNLDAGLWLQFQTKNASGNYFSAARISSQSSGITAGAENGRLLFGVMKAGAVANAMTITEDSTLLVNTIATDGTSAKLQVNGGINATGNILSKTTDDTVAGCKAYLYSDASRGYIEVWNGNLSGSKPLTLNQNGGAVLVGTVTADGSAAKLQVAGSINATGLGIRNGGGVAFENGDNTNYIYIQNNGATGLANPHLGFFQAGVGETMRINGSGSLIIGNSGLDNGTGAKLQVAGTLSAYTGLYNSNVIVGATTSTNVTIGGNQIHAMNNGVSSPLYIQYSSQSNTCINALGGNVLVGTATDNGSGAKLQVDGSITAEYSNSIGFTFSDANQAVYNSISKPSSGNSPLTFTANYGPAATETIFDFVNSVGSVLAIKQSGDLSIGSSGYSPNLVLGRTDGYQRTTLKGGTGASGNDFKLSVGAIDALTIDQTGNLLVGIASQLATERLNITGNTSYTAVMNNTRNVDGDTCLYLNMGANTNTLASKFITGNVASVGQRFTIFGNGNIQNANNSYGAISDLKLKQDIIDTGSQWDDIKALRLKKYHFKNDPDGHLQLGLIAQEAELVSPGLVDETPDYAEVKTIDEEGNETTERVATGETTKSVKYSILYLKAVGALQENMKRTEALEQENIELKLTLASILERLEALETK